MVVNTQVNDTLSEARRAAHRLRDDERCGLSPTRVAGFYP
jgi:hypothetical protein